MSEQGMQKGTEKEARDLLKKRRKPDFSPKVITEFRFDPQISEEALWGGFFSFMYLFILSSNIYFNLSMYQAP